MTRLATTAETQDISLGTVPPVARAAASEEAAATRSVTSAARLAILLGIAPLEDTEEDSVVAVDTAAVVGMAATTAARLATLAEDSDI